LSIVGGCGGVCLIVSVDSEWWSGCFLER